MDEGVSEVVKTNRVEEDVEMTSSKQNVGDSTSIRIHVIGVAVDTDEMTNVLRTIATADCAGRKDIISGHRDVVRMKRMVTGKRRVVTSSVAMVDNGPEEVGWFIIWRMNMTSMMINIMINIKCVIMITAMEMSMMIMMTTMSMMI